MGASCFLEIIAAFWSLFLGSTHLSGRLAEEKLGTWLLPSSQTDTPLPRDGFFHVTFVFRLCREIQFNISQCLIPVVQANPTSLVLIRTNCYVRAKGKQVGGSRGDQGPSDPGSTALPIGCAGYTASFNGLACCGAHSQSRVGPILEQEVEPAIAGSQPSEPA